MSKTRVANGLSAARKARPSKSSAWLSHHKLVAADAIRRLRQRPFAQFLTLSAIAVVIALPSLLFIVFNGVQQLSGDWQSSAKIVAYMDLKTPSAQTQKISQKLRNKIEVKSVTFISADSALQEYSTHSGYGDLLGALDVNPLPDTLIIEPADNYRQPGQVDAFALQLNQIQGINDVQVDVQWLRRLHAIAALLQRVALVIASLLGFAVILIIGNTIRLEITDRKDEISVIQLIGATHAFVRRPFLYTGVLYGTIGGILALLLTSIATTLINEPVRQLADLYRVEFIIQGLGFMGSFLIICSAALLGLIGAWMATSRHLSEKRTN